MSLAVIIIDGHGHSNKVQYVLELKRMQNLGFE